MNSLGLVENRLKWWLWMHGMASLIYHLNKILIHVAKSITAHFDCIISSLRMRQKLLMAIIHMAFDIIQPRISDRPFAHAHNAHLLDHRRNVRLCRRNVWILPCWFISRNACKGAEFYLYAWAWAWPLANGHGRPDSNTFIRVRCSLTCYTHMPSINRDGNLAVHWQTIPIMKQSSLANQLYQHTLIHLAFSILY